MITAILVYEHPQAFALVEALKPDNTPEIRMKPIGKKVLVEVRANNLRTVVASCDDLFANLQIAQEILSDSEESTGFESSSVGPTCHTLSRSPDCAR